jgi:hypothetical protein
MTAVGTMVTTNELKDRLGALETRLEALRVHL